MTSYVIAANNAYSSRSDENFALGFLIEHDDPNLDILDAMKKAAEEYSKTADGKITLGQNSGYFNYGDFANNVPNEICKKYGFTVTDTFITHNLVEHDDLLLNYMPCDMADDDDCDD